MKDETAFQKWKNLWIRRLQDKYIDVFNSRKMSRQLEVESGGSRLQNG